MDWLIPGCASNNVDIHHLKIAFFETLFSIVGTMFAAFLRYLVKVVLMIIFLSKVSCNRWWYGSFFIFGLRYLPRTKKVLSLEISASLFRNFRRTQYLYVPFEEITIV